MQPHLSLTPVWIGAMLGRGGGLTLPALHSFKISNICGLRGALLCTFFVTTGQSRPFMTVLGLLSL